MRRWGPVIGGLVLVGLALGWLAVRAPEPATRDLPLAPPLPDTGGLDIVVLGTSLSAPPQHWPDALAEALAACRGAPVRMERVAGPGMGSAWGQDQVAAVARHAPDLVLVEFAINDADLLDGVSPAQGWAQHLALVAGLRRALPQVRIVLMTMSPAKGSRGWIRPRLGAHYGQYHDLAQAAGTGLIDLYPRWLALPPSERGLEADGLHPDPARAARVIISPLVRYLDPTRKCR